MAKVKLPSPSSEQTRAWGFYGTPARGTVSGNLSSDSAGAIGELRFVIGWLADQLTRMGWRVAIDGSETWRLTTPGGVTIYSDSDEADMEKASHPVNASRDLLDEIMWNDRTVREVATNLFVAGELHYALDSTETWRVVSVIRQDRQKIIDSSSIVVHGLWPHPADPSCPDAPTFGVLGTLDDMLWLNRQSRGQSANRVGTRGIVLVADQMHVANGSAETFTEDFYAAVSRPMDDPEDVSPVVIVGPAELVKGAGKGAEGMTWIIPDFPYDEHVDSRMEKLVERLAYGLPIPPEILLGLQASSRATAFQVEGASYRAHIEPMALLVAQVATDTLKLFLPEQFSEVEVVPDPTDILARKHSVQDVLEGFDRGAVGYQYLREVLGIPERAEPTPEDIALWLRVNGRTVAVEGVSDDPANIAAEEPAETAITAAAPAEPSLPAEAVAEVLQRIDSALLHGLTAQVEAALSKAWEKIGARLRTTPEGKKLVGTASNEEVGRQFAAASLTALGADGNALLDNALASLLSWWQRRATEAQAQAAQALAVGEIPVEFSPRSLDASTELLRELVTEAVRNGTSVAALDLRSVLDLAGEAV